VLLDTVSNRAQDSQEITEARTMYDTMTTVMKEMTVGQDRAVRDNPVPDGVFDKTQQTKALCDSWNKCQTDNMNLVFQQKCEDTVWNLTGKLGLDINSDLGTGNAFYTNSHNLKGISPTDLS
jgi:hypothetical protein